MSEQLIQSISSTSYSQVNNLAHDLRDKMSDQWSDDSHLFDEADLTAEWQIVCHTLEKELGDKLALRWLKRIIPHHLSNGQVHLIVPSPCILELVKRNYADQILLLWQKENTNIQHLVFELNTADTNVKTESCTQTPLSPIPTTPVNPMKTYAMDKVEIQIDVDGENIPCFLDKTHTFDSFVVGPSNEFAYVAAKRVAEDKTIAFNPLYIHAPVGLGKTHLMHAIAWRIKELYPNQNVLYLSSEQFIQHFIKALRHNNTDSFRQLFQTIDVLMIDDVQFISGKQRSQEEFFHTFNQLIARGKKIILSADSNPMDLQGIEERTKTRIAQGLVVQIQPTTYELRLGILQKKIQESKIFIPENVIEFLAKNITASVRELEGALKRLIAHAELIGTPINMDTAQMVLKDILQVYERQFSVYEIQQATASYYGLKLSDLKSTRRERKIARPRQLAMYLAKTMTALSLPDIGAQFDRDHTTIIHAVRTIEDLLVKDPKLATDKDNIIVRIKEGV